MKTEAIKRCIDNGSDVRDALEAQVELYAIEAEFDKAEDIRKTVIEECEEVMSMAWAKQQFEPFPDADAALTHCHIRIRALSEEKS